MHVSTKTLAQTVTQAGDYVLLVELQHAYHWDSQPRKVRRCHHGEFSTPRIHREGPRDEEASCMDEV